VVRSQPAGDRPVNINFAESVDDIIPHAQADDRDAGAHAAPPKDDKLADVGAAIGN